MNPTGKKFISLFLVFSLMMISVNLYAKKRQGVNLLITKKNGVKTEGELITVKKDSLLILTKWTERDVSIDIADIRIITIAKKSKTSLGGYLGILVGGGAGALYGYEAGLVPSEGAKWGGVIGVVAGVILGSFIGSSLGKDKTFQIEGMTDSEIQETLDKLRKKARVRDYK
jgi:hypothetical protein